jgi:hypothetical protein
MEQFSNDGRPRRREYSKPFKAQVVAQCAQPGASVGGVALAGRIRSSCNFDWIFPSVFVPELAVALAGLCLGAWVIGLCWPSDIFPLRLSEADVAPSSSAFKRSERLLVAAC